MEKAKQRETIAKDEKARAYEAHLAAVEQELVVLHSQAEIKREGEYQAACRKQIDAKTISEYQDTIKVFLKMEGYRDSDKHAAQCQEAFEEFKEKDRIRKEAEAKAEAEKVKRSLKIFTLTAEKTRLEEELPTIMGLFSGKRRKEIEARLAEIEAELKELR